MTAKNNRRGTVGSSFDAFLAEEGILEECEERATKEKGYPLDSSCPLKRTMCVEVPRVPPSSGSLLEGAGLQALDLPTNTLKQTTA
jgi:hypothetical protein